MLFVVARVLYTYGGAAAMPSAVGAAVFFSLVTLLTIAAVTLLVRLPFTRRLA